MSILLRWKSVCWDGKAECNIRIHLNVITSLEFFFLWYRNNSSPALITALAFRALWYRSISITGLALQLLPWEKCHCVQSSFAFLTDSDLAPGQLHNPTLGTPFSYFQIYISFIVLDILHISCINKMIHLVLIFRTIAFYTYWP